MGEAKNQVVVLTGAGGRLGNFLAKRLLAEPQITPVLLTSDPSKLRIDHGSSSIVHRVVLSDPLSVRKVFGRIHDEQGEIDVLINNAGVNKIDSIQDVAEDDWDWINNVNLRGPFLLTRAVSKIMKNQGYGRMVNIASIFGVVSKAKRAAYSTTKWGLVGFTKAVALDLAPNNILVNAVSPGFVDTELTRRILGEKEIEKLVDTIPQKRLADAGEIAKTVVFLSSHHNTYITGQNIIVDGGFTSA